MVWRPSVWKSCSTPVLDRRHGHGRGAACASAELAEACRHGRGLPRSHPRHADQGGAGQGRGGLTGLDVRTRRRGDGTDAAVAGRVAGGRPGGGEPIGAHCDVLRERVRGLEACRGPPGGFGGGRVQDPARPDRCPSGGGAHGRRGRRRGPCRGGCESGAASWPVRRAQARGVGDRGAVGAGSLEVAGAGRAPAAAALQVPPRAGPDPAREARRAANGEAQRQAFLFARVDRDMADP
mmetsp:Transcript_27322/g.78168  ORF Transcript_27322/g.78168 Transcript_27322/m.78168 type:complete len:237 (+) Transcript_27322:19-729(+)